jgi:hypothetical protein
VSRFFSCGREQGFGQLTVVRFHHDRVWDYSNPNSRLAHGNQYSFSEARELVIFVMPANAGIQGLGAGPRRSPG